MKIILLLLLSISIIIGCPSFTSVSLSKMFCAAASASTSTTTTTGTRTITLKNTRVLTSKSMSGRSRRISNLRLQNNIQTTKYVTFISNSFSTTSLTTTTTNNELQQYDNSFSCRRRTCSTTGSTNAYFNNCNNDHASACTGIGRRPFVQRLQCTATATSIDIDNDNNSQQVKTSASKYGVVTASSLETSSSNSKSISTLTTLKEVEQVFNKLAKTNRSWKRLSPLVEMAMNYNNNYTNDNESTTSTTIVDIGTDHGLLAYALAIIPNNKYSNVIGIDVSLDALIDGAYNLYNITNERYDKLNNNQTIVNGNVNISTSKNSTIADTTSISTSTSTSSLFNINNKINFRHGNGLYGLNVSKKEYANVICIAGMGINTIISILTAKALPTTTISATTTTVPISTTTTTTTTTANNELSSSLLVLHQLQCYQIIIQTTSSKPKHLLELYHCLYNLNYIVKDEKIVYVDKRWYVSTSFIINNNNKSCYNSTSTSSISGSHGTSNTTLPVLPGSILAAEYYKHRTNGSTSTITDNQRIFLQWVQHHYEWIQSNQHIVQKQTHKQQNQEQQRQPNDDTTTTEIASIIPSDTSTTSSSSTTAMMHRYDETTWQDTFRPLLILSKK